jgi:hypothetical protein
MLELELFLFYVHDLVYKKLRYTAVILTGFDRGQQYIVVDMWASDSAKFIFKLWDSIINICVILYTSHNLFKP